MRLRRRAPAGAGATAGPDELARRARRLAPRRLTASACGSAPGGRPGRRRGPCDDGQVLRVHARSHAARGASAGSRWSPGMDGWAGCRSCDTVPAHVARRRPGAGATSTDARPPADRRHAPTCRGCGRDLRPADCGARPPGAQRDLDDPVAQVAARRGDHRPRRRRGVPGAPGPTGDAALMRPAVGSDSVEPTMVSSPGWPSSSKRTREPRAIDAAWPAGRMTTAVRSAPLELLDAALEEGLLAARRLVVGVLAQVAELAGVLDALDDLRAARPCAGAPAPPRRAARPSAVRWVGCVARRLVGRRRPRRRGRPGSPGAGAASAPTLAAQPARGWSADGRSARTPLGRGVASPPRRRSVAQPGRSRDEPRRATRGWPRAAPGCRPARSVVGGSTLGEGAEEGVLVLLGGVGLGPPEAQPRRLLQRLEPVAAGVRAPVAQLGGVERRDAAGQAPVRAAHVEERLVGHPEGRQAAGRATSAVGRSPSSRSVGDAFEPATHRGVVDGRADGTARRVSTTKMPAALAGRQAAPASRAVDLEAQGAHEVGAADPGSMPHRVTQDAAGTVARRRLRRGDRPSHELVVGPAARLVRPTPPRGVLTTMLPSTAAPRRDVLHRAEALDRAARVHDVSYDARHRPRRGSSHLSRPRRRRVRPPRCRAAPLFLDFTGHPRRLVVNGTRHRARPSRAPALAAGRGPREPATASRSSTRTRYRRDGATASIGSSTPRMARRTSTPTSSRSPRTGCSPASTSRTSRPPTARRSAPRALGGRLGGSRQPDRAARRAVGGTPLPGHAAVLHLPLPAHRGPLRARRRPAPSTSRSGLLGRRSMRRELERSADEILDVTSQGLDYYARPLRSAVPLRQVRPALRPRVQRRGHGERGRRHLPRPVPLPRPAHLCPAPRARRGRPPRAGPHVVRRPRDDALVGRPVAQRDVRHLPLVPLPGGGDALRRRLAGLQRRHAPGRAPPGPARHHATRSPRSWSTPTRRWATSTPSPTRRVPPSSSSSWPPSATRPSGPACMPTSSGTPGATRRWRTSSTRSAGCRRAARRLGPRSGSSQRR